MRLEAKSVSFRYGKRQAWVLQNLNFCVEQGTCIGLSAPSGAGKSTLAMLLAGYLMPVEGAVLLNGKPLLPPRCLPSTTHLPASRAGSEPPLGLCAGYLE